MGLIWYLTQMLCLRVQRVQPMAFLGGLSLSHQLLRVSHSDHHVAAKEQRVPYDLSGARDVSNPSFVFSRWSF